MRVLTADTRQVLVSRVVTWAAEEESPLAPKAGSEKRTSVPHVSPSNAHAGDEEAVNDESDDEHHLDAEATVESPVDGNARDNSGGNGSSTGDMRVNHGGNGTSTGDMREESGGNGTSTGDMRRNSGGNGASAGDVRGNASGRDSQPESECMEMLNHSGGSGDPSAGRSDHSTSADGSPSTSCQDSHQSSQGSPHGDVPQGTDTSGAEGGGTTPTDTEASHQPSKSAVTASRQLAPYMKDPQGQETQQYGRTRSQTRALQDRGLVSAAAHTGPDIKKELRKATAMYTALLCTGQGEPIGKLLKDVESAPRSLAEARRSFYSKLWEEAMMAEFGGLQASGTFVKSQLPEGRKPITSRWLYRWKSNEFGEITKPKARLVARGFS